MNHIVVDLETLGTEADAVILSLGAVLFDPHAEDTFDSITEDRCFHRAVNIDSQLDIPRPRTVNHGTFKFWLNDTSPDARRSLSDSLHIAPVLLDFTTWVRDKCEPPKYLWGYGASFDNAILAHALRQFGFSNPFQYRSSLCLRTLVHLAGIGKIEVPQAVKHNALADAKCEVLWAQAAVKKLGVRL